MSKTKAKAAETNGATAQTQNVSVADYLAQRIAATQGEILKLQGSLAELRHLQSVMKTPDG
mgnify:FL=1